MKNIVLSAVAVLAMSSLAVAGGDITPIEEPEVVVEEVMAPDAVGGFYLGLGYGSLSGDEDFKFNPGNGEVSIEEDSRDFDELMIMAGYQFNAYVAIEGRYWFGMNDIDGRYYDGLVQYDTDQSLDAWGIYVKPMYPVTDAFNVYALLGYGGAGLSEDYHHPDTIVTVDTDLDGFSWGLGVSYTFNDNVGLFVDYVSNYNDTVDYDFYNASSDFTIQTWNVGVSYKF